MRTTPTSLLVFLVLAVLSLSGCEREGPFERAGEQVDEAIDKAGENLKDATGTD